MIKSFDVFTYAIQFAIEGFRFPEMKISSIFGFRLTIKNNNLFFYRHLKVKYNDICMQRWGFLCWSRKIQIDNHTWFYFHHSMSLIKNFPYEIISLNFAIKIYSRPLVRRIAKRLSLDCSKGEVEMQESCLDSMHNWVTFAMILNLICRLQSRYSLFTFSNFPPLPMTLIGSSCFVIGTITMYSE